jgi:hypothetical protein
LSRSDVAAGTGLLEAAPAGNSADFLRVDPVAPGTRHWLTKGVGSVGIASFLADLGHEVPTSLLPSFLAAALGVPASIGLAYMPQYKDPLVAQAKNLSSQSAVYDAGAKDRSNGDGYVRVTVMLAAVPFLLAVCQRFRVRSVRLAMSGVAGAFLVYSIILLITYLHA